MHVDAGNFMYINCGTETTGANLFSSAAVCKRKHIYVKSTVWLFGWVVV